MTTSHPLTANPGAGADRVVARSDALDRRDALERRFGAADTAGPWNEVLATRLAHRSVRRFLDRPVPEDHLRAVVAAASSAASSSNLQLWSVVAVTDRERIDALATLAGDQDAVRRAPLFLVWLADFARSERIATVHGRELVNADFAEGTLLGVVDAALAAQNAVVAAESIGLGTAYIGGIRNEPERVADVLELPQRVFPVVGLSVGFPDPAGKAEVEPRLGFDVVCHRDRYRLEAQDAGIARYDTRAEDFYRGQGLPGSWTGRIVARLTDPGTLGSRRRIRDALRERGFPTN